MVLVKNLKFIDFFFLGNNNNIVIDFKKVLCAVTDIYPKRLVHGFGENIEVLGSFSLRKNSLRKSVWRRSRK